jgi:hypothetical protein
VLTNARGRGHDPLGFRVERLITLALGKVGGEVFGAQDAEFLLAEQFHLAVADLAYDTGSAGSG